MATIFLSHTSIDKPFVEKLAKDLNNLGINVWYDKYQIKVGESILWKIDEGIRVFGYCDIKRGIEIGVGKNRDYVSMAKTSGTKGKFCFAYILPRM